jgi:thiol-disulfide isomerase/thioredoxin
MSVRAYYFWSPTCGPCKVIRPNIDELRGVFSSVDFTYINVYEDREGLAEAFKITVVPTVMVVAFDKDGNVLYRGKHSGADMLGYYRILRAANQQLSK